MQQPELGGGELVLGHVPQGAETTVQPRPRAGLAAVRHAAQHRHVELGEDANRFVLGQVAADERDHAPPVHDDGEEQQDDDEGQDRVDEGEPGARPGQRAVPQRVQRHGGEPAQADRPKAAALGDRGCIRHARADQRGEQCLADRGRHAAQHERGGQIAEAVMGGLRVIEDVLDQREAKADHAPVDDPVADAVDLLRAQPQQPDEGGAHERVLEHGHADRGRGGRGDKPAGPQRRGGEQLVAGQLADQRDQRGRARSPQKDEDQAAGRLGFQPVEGEHGCEQDGNGQQRQG